MHRNILRAGRTVCACVTVALMLSCAPGSSRTGSAVTTQAPADVFPPPIDPQRVRDQDDMTWDDYKPVPGAEWTDTARRGTNRQINLAVVVADFPDQPFVMTLPKKSDMYGNPQIDPIKREQVPQFMYDFYMIPNKHNHGRTIHEYWMEQSRGRVGVTTTVFGPYRMPGPTFIYGGMRQEDMPSGYTVSNGLQRQLDSIWRADKGDSIQRKFDLTLRMYAGYDETATWQEFGEMKFQTPQDIPKEWGNPDTTKPRSVRSRYGAWTPWHASKWLWANAGGGNITQGETSNTIRHELGHAAFSIGDNYNNPFAEPRRRAPVGPWDLMDRGSFNGPGGPHTRWQVPPNQGGSMSAGVMLRQRMYFKFTDSSMVLMLTRGGLAQTGLAVARVLARSVDPVPGTVAGLHVRLDGDSGKRDLTPVDNPATNPLSSGNPTYDFYTMEVVQRIGYDSYVPDNGVLISKNKDRTGPVGGPNGYNTYTWTIDAHPEDINKLDFRRPNGEPVMRSIADYRQLNDALFHAGTNSGSSYEWDDVPNRLRFYVVDVHRDARGVLSYTLAAKSLDGAGPQRRGVAVVAPASGLSSGRLNFTVSNTGASAAIPAVHATTTRAHFDYDIYRLKVAVAGEGWEAGLQNALAAIEFGKTQTVPVFIRRNGNASPTATVSLTATSESDPTKTVTTSFDVKRSP